MALRLEEKKTVVSAITQVATSAHSALAMEYQGLTASELTGLRAKAREQGVCLKVVKNTLAKRALEGTSYECMCVGLVGPLMLAFSQEDLGSAARLARDFMKDNNLLVVKMVSVGGELLKVSELSKLSDLPSREEAIGMVMAVMRAPVEKFVRTLAQPYMKLVKTIAAVRDQKQIE